MHSATEPPDWPIPSSRQILAAAVWYALIIAEAILLAPRLVALDLPRMPELLACGATLLIAFLASFASVLGFSSASPRERRRAAIAALLIAGAWAVPAGLNSTTAALGLNSAILALQAGMLMSALRTRTPRTSPTHGESPASTSSLVQLSVTPRLDADSTIVPATPKNESPTAPPALQIVPREDDHHPLAESESREQAWKLEESSGEDLEEADAAANQTQWYSRFQRDDTDVIEGWVRVDFEPGQREVTVHLSFCPPLATTPEIETEDLDGLGIEIRVAAAFTFGARLSVRRSGPAQHATQARVGFSVQAPVDRQVA